jgi:hypothetical protein
LFSATAPWRKAASIHTPTFFARYSLHDSTWVGLATAPYTVGGKWSFQWSSGCVAVFHWDTAFDASDVPGPGAIEWPLLLIHFEEVYEVSLRDPGGFVARAASWELTAAERQHVATRMFKRLRTFREALSWSRGDHDALQGWWTRFVASWSEDRSAKRMFRTRFDGVEVEILHGGQTRALCVTNSGIVLPIPTGSAPS